MSSSQDERSASTLPSARRRRLVQGAVAAVPTILTLRPSLASTATSNNLIGQSTVGHPVDVNVYDDAGNFSGTEPGQVCADTVPAEGYPDKYHVVQDPQQICGAENDATEGTQAQCENAFHGNGILVSTSSLTTANINITDGTMLNSCKNF